MIRLMVMGIKHLRQISGLLSGDKRWFSLTEVRDSLSIDRNTLFECVDYLVDEGKVKIRTEGRVTRIRWK